METFSYSKSQEFFSRAANVIPGGIYGHYSPVPLIPATHYPFYTARAKGARFWDVDGNEFIDYMCAFGPMIQGYQYSAVDHAALEQLKSGNLTTGAPAVMVELAEYLTDLVPFANWAYFAKNGADVTNYATMIARDATGRKKIVMIKGGYHGAAPWMQVPGHHGLIEEDYHHIIRIKWNDIKAFEDAISENPKEIAGFIATPYHVPVFKDNEMPADGYWQKVEAICRQEGIVLIIDEIRHGFRLDMSGSNEYFGFKPDLLCLGKALANGYPISALLGTDALKNIAARTFYTGSFFFEAVPMAAGLVNLKGLEEIQGPQIMQTQGKKLTDAMVDMATGFGFTLKVSGVPSMPYLRITDDESMMLHQEWCAECTRRGAYFTPHHNWFLSTAHTAQDIDQTLEIVDDAFRAVKKKWEDEKL